MAALFAMYEKNLARYMLLKTAYGKEAYEIDR